MHIHAVSPGPEYAAHSYLLRCLLIKQDAKLLSSTRSPLWKQKVFQIFGAWFRSRDLRVMGPPRFRCATPNLRTIGDKFAHFGLYNCMSDPRNVANFCQNTSQLIIRAVAGVNIGAVSQYA